MVRSPSDTESRLWQMILMNPNLHRDLKRSMLLYFISCFELLLKKHVFNEKIFDRECHADVILCNNFFPLLTVFFFHSTHLQLNKTVIKTQNSLKITVPLVTSRDPSNGTVEKNVLSEMKCVKTEGLRFF